MCIFKEFYFGIKVGVSDFWNVELNFLVCVFCFIRVGGIIEEFLKLKWSVFFLNYSIYEVVEFVIKEIVYIILNMNK